MGISLGLEDFSGVYHEKLNTNVDDPKIDNYSLYRIYTEYDNWVTGKGFIDDKIIFIA